jgi:hypothetical protein
MAKIIQLSVSLSTILPLLPLFFFFSRWIIHIFSEDLPRYNCLLVLDLMKTKLLFFQKTRPTPNFQSSCMGKNSILSLSHPRFTGNEARCALIWTCDDKKSVGCSDLDLQHLSLSPLGIKLPSLSTFLFNLTLHLSLSSCFQPITFFNLWS